MERIGTKGVCSEADGIERFNYSGSQLYGIQTQPVAFPHKATVYTQILKSLPDKIQGLVGEVFN